jgi:hypothetical protein
MEGQVIKTLGWILLDYSRYDGGDDDGGSLIGLATFWSQLSEDVKSEIFYNLNPYKISNDDIIFMKSTLSKEDHNLYVRAKL